MRAQILSTLVALGTIAAARPARAQEAVPVLDEAAFLAALERDPRRARQDAEVAAAEAAAVAAGVRANPSLAIDREEVFPDGGVATSYARIVWPLDLAGRRGRRAAAARTDARAVAADQEAARTALAVEGMRAFHDAAHARLAVALLRADRDGLARAVETVRRRAGAGAASGYEVQRAELELAAYDDALASAQVELDRARAALGALAGLPAADAGSDLALPPVPADAAALASGAAEARGDHRAARLRAEAADRRAALAGRGWIPEVGIAAGAMAADVDGATAFGYTLGLTLSLPIFDRGQGERATAAAARRVAEADRRVLDATVPARIRAARDVLAARVAQAERLATDQLARLEPMLRAAESGYREGETGLVDLLDAYRAARTARLRDLELRRDARHAELDLWLALGRRP